MLVDVGCVREIAGYLVPGMSFGKQLGLDPVQDVVDYSMLLPCLLLFDGILSHSFNFQINYPSPCAKCMHFYTS